MNDPFEELNLTTPYRPPAADMASQHSDPVSTDAGYSTQGPSGGSPVSPVEEVPGYEILGEIARGAMGKVLAARDRQLDREVAIKVLLEGNDRRQAAARFVRESQIAARLPHPGIPPVHALGMLPSGTPFLVMKLIRGRTLADLIGQRLSGHHDLPRWLQIFEQIAQAVGFAHARGIIHRDLKPANIMVGEFGEVQVMDWGLAKSLNSPAREVAAAWDSSEEEPTVSGPARDSATATGAVMGTPAFMAPEQARGEQAGPAADVFALGAILSVMLTGTTPFGGGKTVGETIRLAAAADISPVFRRLDSSSADAALIALAKRCLAPAARDRFPDAQAVATAVAEYRLGVEDRLRRADAERSTALAREAEQRKRRQVVQWAALLVVIVLTLGILGTTLGMVQAHQARLAEASQKQQALEAARSEKAAHEHTQDTQKILLEIFADLDLRKVKADKVPLEQVLAGRLEKAGRQLDAQAEHDPLAVAQLLNQLAVSLQGLGFPRQALPLAQKSADLRTAHFGADDRATLTSRNTIAVCYYQDGNYAAAEPIYEDILQKRIALLGADHPETLLSMSNLGDCYRAAGKKEPVLPLYKEALHRRTEVLGLDNADTLTSMNNLASAYYFFGDYNEALPLFVDCLKRRQALLGPNHFDTLTSLGNLAMCYTSLGQLEVALPHLEEVLNRMTAKLGFDHPSTLTAMSNLGVGYQSAGKFDRAIPLLEDALQRSRYRLGADHPDTLLTTTNLAACYNATNQWDRAVPLMEEVLKLQTAKLGEDHLHTLIAMNNLALGYQNLKKFDKAVPLYQKALERMQTKYGTDHHDAIGLMSNLGMCYQAVGQHERAIPLLVQVLKYRTSKQGPDHALTLSSLTNLAEVYVESNQGEKAVPLYEEFLNRMRKRSRPNDPIFAGYLLQSAPRLMQANQFAAAEKQFREALEILEKLAPTNWATAETKSQLGGALMSQKKYADARPLLIAGYEGMSKAQPKPKQATFKLVTALDRLIKLSKETEMPDEVKQWQAEKDRLLASSPGRDQ